MAYLWNPICVIFLSRCLLFVTEVAGTAIVLPEDALGFSPRCWALDPLHDGDLVNGSDVLYADLYNVTMTPYAFDFPPPSGGEYNMSSMCFSGSRSSYALIAHSGQISAVGDFAWVLVVKPSCQCQGVIMEYESDASSYFLSVRQSNDNFKMDFQTPETTYKASFPGFNPITSWKMFIISYSTSTGKFSIFYGDFPKGKLIQKTLDMTFSSFNATGTVRLGSSEVNTSVPFTGCLGCLAYFPWAVGSVNSAVQGLCNPAGAYSTVWTLHSERTRRPLGQFSSSTAAEQQTMSEMTSQSDQTTVSSSSSAQVIPDTSAGEASTDSTTAEDLSSDTSTPAATATSSAAPLSSTPTPPATSLTATSTPDPASTSDLSKETDVMRVVYDVSTHAHSSAAAAAETLEPWSLTEPTTSLTQDTPPAFSSVSSSSVPTGQCRPLATQNPGSILCACKHVQLQVPVTHNATPPQAVPPSVLDFPSTELSAKRRKKGCASDNRTSAVTLGLSGVLVVVLVVSTFVLHDVYRVVVYIYTYPSRQE